MKIVEDCKFINDNYVPDYYINYDPECSKEERKIMSIQEVYNSLR
jgi:hypothetical protein